MVNVYLGYLAMFELLDFYYFNLDYKKSFLGAMLGAMNPYGDIVNTYGMPIDIAYWNDWLLCIDKKLPSDIVTRDIILKSVYLFLEKYYNEYEFDFLPNVIKYINSKSGYDKFIEIIEKIEKNNIYKVLD